MHDVIKRKYFAKISLLTIFTLVLYVLTALTLVRSTAEAKKILSSAKENHMNQISLNFTKAKKL